MSERYLALLEVPILDRPNGAAIFAEPDDRRFRNQEGLRELDRRNVYFSLLAEVKIVRQLIERYLRPDALR